MNIRMFILEDLLQIFSIKTGYINTPISVETLDLGKIPMLLVPQLPIPHTPNYAAALERYSTQLANTPIGPDMALWEFLDAALCSPRFANLETLRMDYVIFDPREDHPTGLPEGYAERVKAVVIPCDWLSVTKRIFPLTLAAGRVRLEGRIIEMMPPKSPYEFLDYSKGVCKAQYP